MTTYPTGGFCSRCGSWPCRCGQSTATVNVQYDPMILSALMRIEALLLRLVGAVPENLSSENDEEATENRLQS